VANDPSRMARRRRGVPSLALAGLAAALLASCSGYTNQSLFPGDVKSVYIQMFDNRTFRRGIEYTLSDALAKRIESDTPYRIVSDRDRTDSVLDGQLVVIAESILTVERETGQAMEKEVVLSATVDWKNLRTGRMMVNHRPITAAASYSEFLNQDFTYASALAANKLAEKIVELMQDNW
jgi:hypothetical protein